MSSKAPDWRIGLTVKCKYRNHIFYYERAIVLDVLPTGTGGIFDKDGVLKLKLEGGSVILAPADEWMTA